jgi:hypothetical protein
MSDGKKEKDLYLEALNDMKSLVRETHTHLISLDKKVDLHIQKTELELQRINELDQTQNALLDKHIEGVNTLKKWCDQHASDNDKKFEVLAAQMNSPKKWAQTTVKIVVTLGAVAGALAALKPYLVAWLLKG